MSSLIALMIAGTVGGMLLHLLSTPKQQDVAPLAAAEPDKSPPAPTVPLTMPIAPPIPVQTAIPTVPAISSVPAIPTVPPAPVAPTTSVVLPTAQGVGLPPSRAHRRPRPETYRPRSRWAAVWRLSLLIMALGIFGAVTTAAGFALLARSLQ